MSYKTPRKEKEKIQPPQSVELSEYNKVYYQIYVYKPQDCQRRKGCCWNINDTSLITVFSEPTGSYTYYQVLQF